MPDWQGSLTFYVQLLNSLSASLPYHAVSRLAGFPYPVSIVNSPSACTPRQHVAAIVVPIPALNYDGQLFRELAETQQVHRITIPQQV